MPRGCAFGYLGPNGAGKTTLIRVLLGLTHADAGTMSLLGYAVPRPSRCGPGPGGGHRRRAPIPRPPDRAAEPPDPGRGPRAGGAGPHRAVARTGRASLHRADDKVSKYSMGMRQRLGVAACLIGDPQLLILDEPMNGLDPAGMHEMRDMILSLVAEGRTVVLSSHLLDEVERTCDAVAIVDRGNVIRQGPISELLAGASLELQVECSEPDRARALVDADHLGAQIERRAARARHHAAGGHRAATSSPRSTGSWWKAGSPCTGSSRSRPRSNRGSCRSRADWGHPNDDRHRPSSRVRAPAPTVRAGRRPPGIVDPHLRHDHHPVHGAAQAARAHDRPDRGEHRHPDASSSSSACWPTPSPRSRTARPAATTSTRNLVAGVMYIFGFIVAATLGCTAGSIDLTEGMFRHLVVTGRSRLALYLARIPAGLAIVVPLVAVGFTIVCVVCVFAAPTQHQLRRRERARRSVAHRVRELGRRPSDDGHLRSSLQRTVTANVPCGPNGPSGPNGHGQSSGTSSGVVTGQSTPQLRSAPRPSRSPSRTTRDYTAISCTRRTR